MIALKQELERDEIVSNSASEMDYWVKKQLAKRFYENSGYKVLLGDDFENNMLLHVNNYPFMDRYTRIKTGKKDPFIEKYNMAAAGAIPEDHIIKLLYISRLCSYAGGPGMCDMILIKDGKYELRHIIAEDSMRRENALFIFLAKFVFGLCDVRMTDVVGQKTGGGYVLDAGNFFMEILGDSMLKKRWENLPEDQFAERYKEKLPFFILQKWLDAGHADGDDIFRNFENLHKVVQEENEEMLKLKAGLESDEKFISMGKSMDTMTLERKLAYIQEKYDMPKSEAIALLNLFL